MAGKTPREAADNCAYFIKETLSCVSSHYVSAFQQSEKLYKIFYEPYAEVQTRSFGPLYISVTQIFRVVPHPVLTGQYKASTQEYSYRLIEDLKEDEILAYHWHPHGLGVKYPHLHVKCASGIHFPTSRVCLEDFVLLLIRDYDIRPKLGRAEWTEILERNKKAFEKMATWKVQH